MSASEASVRRVAWGPMLLVVTALSAAIALLAIRDGRYPAAAAPVNELYFTSGESVARTALSFKSLLADVYWIRAVQYFGSTRLVQRQAAERGEQFPRGQYDLLYPLLDVATTLDPSFTIAYRFGAVFLSEGYPNGPGRPDLAVTLLDKGHAASPDKWQYVYDKAFVYYWTVQDYREAAHWFKEAARLPGAPEWLPGVAASTLALGGDRESSRRLWQQIHDTGDQAYLRENAAFHLRQLEVADVADRLSSLLAGYAARTGERPTGFAPLVAAGILKAEPTDPDGLPFVVNQETGRVEVSADSRYAIRAAERIKPSGAPRP
jgi:hypothetical protein